MLGYIGEDQINSLIKAGKNLTGGAIDAFRKKVSTWYSDFLRVVDHSKNKSLPPEGEQLREKLISNGQKIKKLIESLGVDLNQEAIQKNLGAIFIPIIAAGAAGAVLTLIAKWYSDYKMFELYDSALEKGATPDQAKQALETAKGGTGIVGQIQKGQLNFSTKLIIGGVILGGLFIYFNYGRR
jgi:hypothetical protein